MGLASRARCEWHLLRYLLSSHLGSVDSEEVYHRRALPLVLRGLVASVVVHAPFYVLYEILWRHWAAYWRRTFPEYYAERMQPFSSPSARVWDGVFPPIFGYLMGTCAIACLLVGCILTTNTLGPRIRVKGDLSHKASWHALLRTRYDSGLVARCIIAASAFVVPFACVAGTHLWGAVIKVAVRTWDLLGPRFSHSAAVDRLDTAIEYTLLILGSVLLALGALRALGARRQVRGFEVQEPGGQQGGSGSGL